jgi:hypothetical protein
VDPRHTCSWWSNPFFFIVIFTDDPSFESKLTPLQKIFFQTQGYWILIIIGGVFLSLVLQSLIKSFPWNHIVGSIGIFGFICLFVFFSAYF